MATIEERVTSLKSTTDRGEAVRVHLALQLAVAHLQSLEVHFEPRRHVEDLEVVFVEVHFRREQKKGARGPFSRCYCA